MTYTDNPLQHAWFVYFDFLSGPYRVWNGFRYLDLGGYTWNPVGPLATIEQIEDPVSDSIPSVVMKVSGVDSTLITDALSGSDEIQGRLAFIYDCFFDSDWQPVTSLEAYAMLRMDTIKVSQTRNQTDGSWDRVISLTCESFMTQGPYPPNGRYTTADQTARYPGVTDLYFEFIPQNQNRRLRWPTF